MVIWMIGMSGAGKTAIGRRMFEQWQAKCPNTVLVDGDEIRAVFKHDRGPENYTVEGRRRNADRICEICAWLDRQGINVVCCILSIFEESREWNRRTYSRYYEVFVDVPMEKLLERDNKGLYAPAIAGETKNVVGVDIPFNPPQNPDLVFENTDDAADLDAVAAMTLEKALGGGNP